MRKEITERNYREKLQRGKQRLCRRAGSFHDQLGIADGSFRKSTFTIAKIEIPQSHEGIIQSQGFDLIDSCVHILSPLRKSSHVVRTDLFQMDQSQIGALCGG